MSHLLGGGVAEEKQLVSRQEAIELGLVRYFTGEACKRGHVAERYTLGGGCTECQRELVEKQREAVRKAREAAQSAAG